MDLQIHNSKKTNALFLFGSAVILIFFIYRFFNENNKYPSNNTYFYPVFIILGLSLIYFLYSHFDKRPLYKLTDKTIYSRDKNKTFNWSEFTTYKCVEQYQKYFNRKYIELYDKDDQLLLVIEVTHTDISLPSIEKRIAKKVKLKK